MIDYSLHNSIDLDGDPRPVDASEIADSDSWFVDADDYSKRRTCRLTLFRKCRLKESPIVFHDVHGFRSALAVRRVAIGPVGLSELTISGSCHDEFSYPSAVARLHAQTT